MLPSSTGAAGRRQPARWAGSVAGRLPGKRTAFVALELRKPRGPTLYERATLSCALLAIGPGIRRRPHAWVNASDAKGQLPGCWRPELGQLGQLIALRGCAAPEDMAAERRRALLRAPPRCRRRGGRVGDGERCAVPLLAADPHCLPGRAARARFWVMLRFFDSGISAMRQAGMRSDTPPTAQASGPLRGRLQIGSPRDGLGDPGFTPPDQRCDRCQDGGEAEQPPPDLRPGDHPVIDAPPGPR